MLIKLCFLSNRLQAILCGLLSLPSWYFWNALYPLNSSNEKLIGSISVVVLVKILGYV